MTNKEPPKGSIPPPPPPPGMRRPDRRRCRPGHRHRRLGRRHWQSPRYPRSRAIPSKTRFRARFPCRRRRPARRSFAASGPAGTGRASGTPDAGARVLPLVEPPAPPLLPELVSEDLQAQVAGLSQRVRAGRCRSLLLAASAAAALLLRRRLLGRLLRLDGVGLCRVGSAARHPPRPLGRKPSGRRLPPEDAGTISFRHAGADRDTELLDRVAGDEVGQSHELRGGSILRGPAT